MFIYQVEAECEHAIGRRFTACVVLSHPNNARHVLSRARRKVGVVATVKPVGEYTGTRLTEHVLCSDAVYR